MERWAGALMLAGCVLALPSAQAEAAYTVQALVKAGDSIGASAIPPNRSGGFVVLQLNDSGRLLFFTMLAQSSKRGLVAEKAGRFTSLYREGDPLAGLQGLTFVRTTVNESGQLLLTLQNQDLNKSLVLYSAGSFSLIAREGGEAPGGQWRSLHLPETVALDPQGNVVFDAQVSRPNASGQYGGLFRWDAGTGQANLIAQTGATSGSFQWDSLKARATNGPGQIAVAAYANEFSVQGLFLFEPGGGARPVALRGQQLPDGGTISDFGETLALDESGRIAFEAVSESSRGEYRDGVYLWTNGRVSATGIVTGADAPGGGKFGEIGRFWINPRDGSLLVAADVEGNRSGWSGLYRSVAGRLTAVMAPGQTTPDGAKNSGPLSHRTWQLSPFNAAGQVAFRTTLQDGRNATYLFSPDGTQKRILASDMITPLGAVYRLGTDDLWRQYSRFPIGLNNRGQIALQATVNTGHGMTDAIFLLTPK
jgi:hypothetical protein